MMESGVPAMVMALSVELGSMSPATCTWAPVDLSNRESGTSTSIQLPKNQTTENMAEDNYGYKNSLQYKKYWRDSGVAEERKQVHTYLSDLFDLAATFTDKGSTLAGWHNDAQCDRRLWGGCTIGHGAANVLKNDKSGKNVQVK